MASLQIHDLNTRQLLDEKALATVRGGMSFNWIMPYRSGSAGSQAPYGTTVNSLQMQVTNVLLVNPVFNNIYQTVIQNELVNIDASDTVDSAINILIDKGQSAGNSSLSFPY